MNELVELELQIERLQSTISLLRRDNTMLREEAQRLRDKLGMPNLIKWKYDPTKIYGE